MKKNNNMSSLLGLLIVLVLAVGALIVFVSQMNGDGDVSSPVSDVSTNETTLIEKYQHDTIVPHSVFA